MLNLCLVLLYTYDKLDAGHLCKRETFSKASWDKRRKHSPTSKDTVAIFGIGCPLAPPYPFLAQISMLKSWWFPLQEPVVALRYLNKYILLPDTNPPPPLARPPPTFSYLHSGLSASFLPSIHPSKAAHFCPSLSVVALTLTFAPSITPPQCTPPCPVHLCLHICCT